MKKLPLVLLMSYVALTLGGCGLFQQSEETTEDTPETPPVAESPQTQPGEPDEIFEDAPQASLSVPTTDGLIPSTDPDARRQQIQQGRNNPFAVIPVKPVIRQKTAENGVGDPETLCKIEEVKTPPTTVAQAPGAAVPVSSSQTVGPPPLLEPILPIPNEARGVFVSGIVKLRGTPVAIVKAPNENVARHVTAGASLSNGQVRVKSININGGQPYVVLEQYGVSVSRGVGEPSEEPVEPPTPATRTLPDGTVEPVAAAEPSIPPPGPNGFGKVRDVVLLELRISGGRASGILCNAGFEPLTVKELRLQVEDKQSGTVLDSTDISLGEIGYTLRSGQKAEFDGSIPEFRGRDQGNVNIELIGWS